MRDGFPSGGRISVTNTIITGNSASDIGGRIATLRNRM